MAMSTIPSPHNFDVSAPVIGCVDGSSRSREVALVAAHYAASVDRPLILYHVIEHFGDPAELPDPIEWKLRRQAAFLELGRLRDSWPEQSGEVVLEFNEGDWLTALADRVGETDALLVIGAPGSDEAATTAGRVAMLVAHAAPASLLLVPAGYAPNIGARPRIAVPIDGSNFAEMALAEAMRLARQLGAELLLIHVVPEAGMTDFGPPAIHDLELRVRLDRRNEQAAIYFLETTRRRLIDQGYMVRSLCLKGDTRTALLRALSEEAPDLVIMSAKGQGGKRCNDLSIGGTASYLLDHLNGLIMLVRPSHDAMARRQPIPHGPHDPKQGHSA